jgi:hypothetical protein
MQPVKRKRDLPLKERWHIEAVHYLHAAVIGGLIAATVQDLVTMNWGDLIFDLTILGNQLLPSRACILTYVENLWRIKAGVRPIKGWISHYILREHEKEENIQIGNAILHCGDMDETIEKRLKDYEDSIK